MTDPGTDGTSWRVLELLAATPVSRTWQVAVGERLAVLRQDEPGARHLGLNRGAEPGVLRAAAAAGLGPDCLGADLKRGLLLTGWLPGRAWSAAELREPGNLRQAAGLLRRLHATPLVGPVVDLGNAIERYAARAGAGAASLAATARAHLARALAVGAPTGATGATVAPLCFCHNDPTPGNFIASPGGDLHLIDWEYAGLCHPGFDLAGLAQGAGFTAEQSKLLLSAYGGRPPTPGETARHRAWEALCASLGALWQAALAGPTGA